MRRIKTFEVIIRQTTEIIGEYSTIEETQARSVASTEMKEDYSEIYAGGLIETVVKFLDQNGVDGLKSLCQAIEMLGEIADEEGHATVFMGPLFETACKIMHKD